jgi:hypothetical protein
MGWGIRYDAPPRVRATCPSHLRLERPMAPSGSCAWQRLPGLRRAGPRPDSARGVVSWGAARPPCDPTSCWAGPGSRERRVILVRVVVGCSRAHDDDGARVKARTDGCQTPLPRLVEGSAAQPAECRRLSGPPSGAGLQSGGGGGSRTGNGCHAARCLLHLATGFIVAGAVWSGRGELSSAVGLLGAAPRLCQVEAVRPFAELRSFSVCTQRPGDCTRRIFHLQPARAALCGEDPAPMVWSPC